MRVHSKYQPFNSCSLLAKKFKRFVPFIWGVLCVNAFCILLAQVYTFTSSYIQLYLNANDLLPNAST